MSDDKKILFKKSDGKGKLGLIKYSDEEFSDEFINEEIGPEYVMEIPSNGIFDVFILEEIDIAYDGGCASTFAELLMCIALNVHASDIESVIENIV